MFNFIGKKEKKSRKGGEELENVDKLEEVRRSLKIRPGKRKEKTKLPSGITADYSSAFFAAALDHDRGSELDRGNEEVVASNTTTVIDLNNGDVYERRGHVVMSSGGSNSLVSATFLSSDNSSAENSMNAYNANNLPPVPPRPPKRGILKGSKTSLVNVSDLSDSRALLMRNTLQNERMGDELATNQISPSHSHPSTSLQPHNLNIMTTPSPSAESLTDTTNSSFATPPFSLSPVGESQGIYSWTRIQQFDDVSLPLPTIKFVSLPPPRELVIVRRKTHDFGFSLRNAIVLDRSESLFIPTSKSVIFAEPGASASNGLLPGDRLIKVNGQSVEKLPREAIIEMIRNSGDKVIVEVQPVAELVELSRRCMPKEGHDEIDKLTQVSDCNTLRRSASKRFKQPEDQPSIPTQSELFQVLLINGIPADNQFNINILIDLTFDSFKYDRATRSLMLENRGDVAIDLSFDRLEMSSATTFFFDKLPFRIIPGEVLEIPFHFYPTQAGLFTERWRVKCEPQFIHEKCIAINLMGVCKRKHLYDDEVAKLEAKIAHKAAEFSAQREIKKIINLSLPKYDESNRDTSIDPIEMKFKEMNPMLTYQPSIVERMSELHHEVAAGGGEWNYDADALYRHIMNIHDNDEMQKKLYRDFNDAYGKLLALKPSNVDDGEKIVKIAMIKSIFGRFFEQFENPINTIAEHLKITINKMIGILET